MAASILDPTPGYHALLGAFDVNRNGRDELFWACGGLDSPTCATLVLESPGNPATDLEFHPSWAMADLRVSPTPCRCGEVTVLADPRTLRSASLISAYDVSGRLVLRERLSPASAASLTVPVSFLRPGLYFLRVEDGVGQPLATGRTIVLR